MTTFTTTCGINFFERSLGKCKACKTPVRVERHASSAPCPNCGATVKVKQVIGHQTGKECDARCMGAVGPSCDCSCGGQNHGAGH